MATVLLILQMFIVIALVGVILLQKTGGDGLAGLSGGGHNVVSGKSSTNFFTKATMVLAVAFMVNSMALAKIAVNTSKAQTSIVDTLESENKLEKNKQKDIIPEAPIAE